MWKAIIAAAVLLILAALLFWQHSREQLVAKCEAHGGAWDGPRGVCVPRPGPVIIQREFYRS